MPPTIVAVIRATCVLPTPVQTTRRSLPSQPRSIFFSFCGSNLVGSGIRNPPHQRRRPTKDVGEGSVVVERNQGGGGGAVVVAHGRVAVVLVLVRERRDDVLKARAGCSPSLGGPGCLMTSKSGMGARAGDGDALQEVCVVERKLSAAPLAWIRTMDHCD